MEKMMSFKKKHQHVQQVMKWKTRRDYWMEKSMKEEAKLKTIREILEDYSISMSTAIGKIEEVIND